MDGSSLTSSEPVTIPNTQFPSTAAISKPKRNFMEMNTSTEEIHTHWRSISKRVERYVGWLASFNVN